MAVTAYGFRGASGAPGVVDDVQWARIGANMAKAAGIPHYVTGCAPSSGGATRLINIATGIIVACNTLGDVPTGQSIALGANATGLSRIDYVIAEHDWGARTIILTSVAGTAAASPVPPSLIQNPGVKWQVPLARVTVRNAVTTIAGADIENCRPVDRTQVVYRGAVATTSGRTTSTFLMSQVDVVDPGWPYRLRINAAANLQVNNVNAVSNGRAYINIDGVDVQVGRTPDGHTGPAVCPGYISDMRSAKGATVQLNCDGTNLGANTWSLVAPHSGLIVAVEPA
jgi:hypothetical protein